jgi:hypothetical protein
MFITVIVFPFFVWGLLWKKFGSLSNEVTQVSIGATYGDLRIDSKAALLYNVVYMLRRLFISGIATLLKKDSYLQVQLMVIHSVFVLVYITAVRPFELPLMNRMEIFNEFCVLLAATHLFWFTDFVPDPEIQYLYGWSLIAVSVLNIFVNMLIMVWMSFRSLKLLYWKLRNKYLEWRIKRRAEARTKKYAEL